MNPMKSTRRGLIAALAASTAAAASSSSPEAAEDTKLVAMGDQINAKLEAHQAACSRVEDIMAEWQPKAPKPPLGKDGEPSIIRFAEGSRQYTDIAGKPIQVQRGPKWRDVVRFGTAETYSESAERHRKKAERCSQFKSKRGMKSELAWVERETACVEHARKYWSEFDNIVVRSGIQAAKQAVKSTREDLHALVSEIMAFEERSIVGLVIKAQALAAWNEVDKFHVMLNLSAPDWSKQISDTIQRRVAA